MCIMCVYKQEPWTDRDARPRICHCARVILDILPWKRRRGGGDRRYCEGNGGIVDQSPGIPIIAVILLASMTPPLSSSSPLTRLAWGAHASIRHEALRFPSLISYETCTCTGWLELDDGVSGAFTEKNRRRDRRKNNEITRSTVVL